MAISTLATAAVAAKAKDFAHGEVTTWLGQLRATWQEIISWGLWKMLGSILIYLIGGWKLSYSALMILLVVDLILGIWRAIRERRANPAIARNKTIAKLGFYWALIIAAHQLGLIAKESGLEGLGDEAPLSITMLYLGATEFISVIRHISVLSGHNFNPFQVFRLMDELKEGKDARSASDSTQQKSAD